MNTFKILLFKMYLLLNCRKDSIMEYFNIYRTTNIVYLRYFSVFYKRIQSNVTKN